MISISTYFMWLIFMEFGAVLSTKEFRSRGVADSEASRLVQNNSDCVSDDEMVII